MTSRGREVWVGGGGEAEGVHGGGGGEEKGRSEARHGV